MRDRFRAAPDLPDASIDSALRRASAARSRPFRRVFGGVVSAAAAALLLLVTFSPASAREGTIVRTLPNGLILILEENHTQPIIAVSLCVKGGSRTETPQISGLSHYYEHLIYRGGSKEQQPLEFRRQMQQLGDESGGFTSDDYTNYGFTVPRENFDEAFRRATDAWLDLVLTEERIDTERQVVLEEYNQDDDRPDDQVYRRLLALVYKVHPYRQSPLGLRGPIEKANLEVFRTFQKERYVPNQMILSMVGDFDADAMAERIARTWGARPPGPACLESGILEPTQKEFRSGEKKMETSTTKALLAFPIPPASQADIPALDLASALLGWGKSSRLWRALKVRSQEAVSVSMWVDHRVDPGYLAVSLETEPAKLDSALRIVTRELTDLRDTPPSFDELTRAREQVLSARESAQETFFDRALALGDAAVMGSLFDVDRYPALLGSVTRLDISRVVRAYIRPDRASLSVVSSTSAGAFDPDPMVAEWTKEWQGGQETSGPEPSGAPVRFQLDNGATVVVVPRPWAKKIGAVALIRGGQWAEPAGKWGLANFTARMLDRGAAGRKAEEIADQLASLGATLNSYGSEDYLVARLEAPEREARAALEVLADILVAPTFPAEEMERLRQDLLASIRSLPDRPFGATNEAFYKRLYHHSPYGNPLEGTEESIGAIRQEELREFYKNVVVGANTVVAVVGPIDLEGMKAWAERRLDVLAPGLPITPGGGGEVPRAAVLDTFLTRNQEQTTFNTGWPAVSVTDPDYLPLRLAARVLRDRLFFKYVYEKGVAYRSWFYLTDRLGQGSIQNEMGVSPGVFKEIAAEVDRDLAAFAEKSATPEELESAKNKLLTRHVLEAQRALSLASSLAFYELSGRGIEGYEAFPREVRAIQAGDVARVAREYIRPGGFLRVAIGRAE